MFIYHQENKPPKQKVSSIERMKKIKQRLKEDVSLQERNKLLDSYKVQKKSVNNDYLNHKLMMENLPKFLR